MNEEKQNAQVKLQFDVMEGGVGPEVKDIKTRTGAQSVKPPQNLPPAPPATSTPLDNEPGGHRLIVKAVAVVVVVAILGLAGYYGYEWFSNRTDNQDIADQTQDSAPEPTLPAQWLVQYFGSEQCDDTEVCGSNADPDDDGLRNIQEVDASTSPVLSDTDNDGITDGDELAVYNTDPIVADSDGDRFEDGIEIRNGFSPVIAISDPATTLERQLWEENISKNGLSEMSEMFLALVPYTSSFLYSTSTPQIYLGYPKDFVVRESYDEGMVQFENPDDELSSALISLELLTKDVASSSQEFISMDINQLSGRYAAQSAKQEVLTAGNKQLHLILLEPTEKVDNAVTRQVAYLQADDAYMYRITFEAPQKNWQRLQTLARIVLGGCRTWPFVR